MAVRAFPAHRVVGFSVALAASAGGCSIYDTSLLVDGTGGAGGSAGPGPSPTTVTTTTTTVSTTTTTDSTTSTVSVGGGGGSTTSQGGGGSGPGPATTSATTSSTSGTGGSMGCTSAQDCPGMDTDCKTRTCMAHVCGFSFTAMGTAVTAQTAKDCSKAVCDGAGKVVQQADDTDMPDDGKECTTDTCDMGAPKFSPRPKGDTCTEGGGKYCDGAGACVECTADMQCMSKVCGANNKCAAPTCMDMHQNGMETDVDCGGSCKPCNVGQSCGANADCVTNTCTASVCAACSGTHLMISEVKSRGVGGAFDEYIELYNPTSTAVTLDSSWSVSFRSDTNTAYDLRWTGAVGKAIGPHGHFLIAGSAYPATDGAFVSNKTITDAGSVTLSHSGTVIDAVCYAYSATTVGHIMNGMPAFTCEGAIIADNPHDNSTGTNEDKSIERSPGGATGNCRDTDDSAADFIVTASTPQSTMSQPTP